MWNLNLFYFYGGKFLVEILILKLVLDFNEKYLGCLEVVNLKFFYKDVFLIMVIGIL